MIVDQMIDESRVLGLNGLAPPPGSLYSDFIRNAAYDPKGMAGIGLRGLGFDASEVLADPSGFGYVQMDDGSWLQPDTGSAITTDGFVVDTTGQIPGAINTGVAQVNNAANSVNSATGPGSISGFFDQFINSFPKVMQGVTTAQLSQINLQRMQAGLPPLSTGQVLGVAGAPPAITTPMILGGLAIIALVVLKK